jgi:hypothetical protein
MSLLCTYCQIGPTECTLQLYHAEVPYAKHRVAIQAVCTCTCTKGSDPTCGRGAQGTIVCVCSALQTGTRCLGDGFIGCWDSMTGAGGWTQEEGGTEEGVNRVKRPLTSHTWYAHRVYGRSVWRVQKKSRVPTAEGRLSRVAVPEGKPPGSTVYWLMIDIQRRGGREEKRTTTATRLERPGEPRRRTSSEWSGRDGSDDCLIRQLWRVKVLESWGGERLEISPLRRRR